MYVLWHKSALCWHGALYQDVNRDSGILYWLLAVQTLNNGYLKDVMAAKVTSLDQSQTLFYKYVVFTLFLTSFFNMAKENLTPWASQNSCTKKKLGQCPFYCLSTFCFQDTW